MSTGKAAGLRAARVAMWAVLPGELALAVCLVAGVRIPGAVLLGAEALVVGVLALEVCVMWPLYAARRRAGDRRREAALSAVRAVVPVAVRRLLVHEFRALHSLGLWVVRRRHRIPEGARPFSYTEPQTGIMWTFVFVSVVETVVLALVIPWPLVHAILLVVDVYGIVIVLALQAACVTRPHLVEADGSLRLRYGALFDLRVPAAVIAAARVDRRFPGGGLVRVDGDGTLDLAVGSQTTVTVELTEPVEFVRPLGRRGSARTLRFNADDPRAAVAALVKPAPTAPPMPAPTPPLTPERTVPSSTPDPPA
ncbi:membrane protein [Streptomyces europaeiscabiei]|nr:membrane protein [Streptomyces europaeiscabiei]